MTSIMLDVLSIFSNLLSSSRGTDEMTLVLVTDSAIVKQFTFIFSFSFLVLAWCDLPEHVLSPGKLWISFHTFLSFFYPLLYLFFEAWFPS